MTPLLLLSACLLPGKDGCPEGTNELHGRCVGDTARPCVTELLSSGPVDGQTDFNAYDDLFFQFAAVDPSAEAWIEGVDTHAHWDRDGVALVLTPDAPLAPLTEYVAGVSWCHGEHEASLSFRTSSVGTPVDVESVPGHVWEVHLVQANMVSPELPFEVVDLLLGDPALLLAATGLEGEELALLGATTTLEGEQDFCANTPSFTASFANNPLVEFGPQDLSFPYHEGTLTLRDVQGSFLVGPGGSEIFAGELSGTLDTRALDPVVDPDGQLGAACEVLAGVGAACQTCLSDGGRYCLDIQYTGIEGTAYLVPLTPIYGECEASCMDEDGLCAESTCGCANGPKDAGFAAIFLAGLALLRRR